MDQRQKCNGAYTTSEHPTVRELPCQPLINQLCRISAGRTDLNSYRRNNSCKPAEIPGRLFRMLFLAQFLRELKTQMGRVMQCREPNPDASVRPP
jgi:hypothetical protein